MVFIECMACGTPTIGANSGGPTEFVKPEQGVLVEEEADWRTELGMKRHNGTVFFWRSLFFIENNLLRHMKNMKKTKPFTFKLSNKSNAAMDLIHSMNSILRTFDSPGLVPKWLRKLPKLYK